MSSTLELTEESKCACDQPRAQQSTLSNELRSLWRANRGRIVLTYGLFNLENLLRLAQPILLGWAINDLLRSSYAGLVAFACGHLFHLLMRTARQMYDSRTFSRIYADRARQLVIRQRESAQDVSRVSARSSLSREFVDFFERHVPLVIRSMYSIAGALVMLVFFDWWIALLCVAMIVPAGVLNLVYGRQTLRIARILHDDLESEVSVIRRADDGEVRGHYGRIAESQIRMSDFEAMNVGLMELFVLGLMVASLLHYCTIPGVGAGDIFAVFRYVLMFVMALDNVPRLVQQVSRLRDIAGRLQTR